jgi:hypothetical protein
VVDAIGGFRGALMTNNVVFGDMLDYLEILG